MSKYVFTNMNITKGVTADEVAQELERITEKHGATRPSDIVDESRPKDAVLHQSFEWNDKRAAELHRQSQARSIIRCVAIVSPETAEPEPVYVHVPKNEETKSGYMPTSLVVKQPDLLELALREMMMRLDSAQRSLDALERAVQSTKNPKKAAQRVRDAAQALQNVRESLEAI